MKFVIQGYPVVLGSSIHHDSDFVPLAGITDRVVPQKPLFRGCGRCLFRGKLSRVTLVNIVFNNGTVFLRKFFVTLQFPFGRLQALFSDEAVVRKLYFSFSL